MRPVLIILALVTAAFAVTRFFFIKDMPIVFSATTLFKDLAHIFVGGLFGAAVAKNDKWLWTMAGALTVIETVAAIRGMTE